MRRCAFSGLCCCIVVGLLACSSAGDSNNDERAGSTPATRHDATTSTTAATDLHVRDERRTTIPPGLSRLAFSDGETVYLTAKGREPVLLGLGSRPVWSVDGRYLAWSFREDASSGDNHPEDYTITILDTTTGSEVSYRNRNDPLSGIVLALPDGFAAIRSGKNNLGLQATEFEVLIPDALRDGKRPSSVAVRFGFDEDHARDIAWRESRNGNLYAEVTGASSSWYRDDPELWMVAPDGTATRLFGECDDAPEGCLSNAGFNAVAVSPDERFVVFDAGTRNGCEVWGGPTLTVQSSFAPIPLTGLPELGDVGTERLQTKSVSWESSTSFLLTIAHQGMPGGEERCSYPAISPDRVYRCDTAGSCAFTGIEAAGAVPGPLGDLAVIESKPDYSGERVVRLRWARGGEDVVIAWDEEIAWAP